MSSTDKPYVALGIPAYRNQVHAHMLYMIGAWTTFAHVNKIGSALITVGSCSIDWARSYLVWQAIRLGAHWLLMTDADNFAGDPVKIMAMMQEGDRRGAAAIAAPVAMRNRPGLNVVMIDPETKKERLADPSEVMGRVERVDRIGAAFMAVNLGWVVKNWPEGPWFETEIKPGLYSAPEPLKRLGEDYFFCDGVRRRGGFICSDGRLELAHADATSETAVLVEDLGARVYDVDPRESLVAA